MDRCIRFVLEEARERGASDIVFKEDKRAILRLYGDMMEVGEVISKEDMERFFNYLKPVGFVNEYLGPPVGIDASFEYKGRYRANFFTSMGKKCMAIRVISEGIRDLQELGLPRNLTGMVMEKKGLSLIVGKTGAGKSTTLAAITQEILKREKAHIITLEDPVEYRFRSFEGEVTQREMGMDFLSFETGITEALRQSPDYIVIGEIRNLSALKAAIMAAEAGHGILGTLHSFGASRTMTRMLSMFPDTEKEFVRYQLSSNLNFILSQQLKFQGKLPVIDYELMVNIPSMENTIREGRFNQIDNLILLGEKQGMKRFGG